MNTLAVFNVVARMDINEIRKFDTQVIPCNFVDLDATLFNIVRGQTNQNCVLAFLSPAFTQFRVTQRLCYYG